jgi:choline transport protein
MFGFSVILMASWEGILSTAALGLGNGGSAGFLYTNLATWLGFVAVYASLGEMGSMAPTSGKHELCCLVVIQNMSDLVQVVSIIG